MTDIAKYVSLYVCMYIYMCIYIYIYYANMSYIQCEGYITFEDTKQVSSIQYIGPISILYCMMVTSPALCAWRVYIELTTSKG